LANAGGVRVTVNTASAEQGTVRGQLRIERVGT
jgi:hypothetical protein